MVSIQPGETSNVEETFYFTAGIARHECVNMSRDSSVPRLNRPRDKVGIDITSQEGLELLCYWLIVLPSHFCKKYFSKTLAERISPRIVDEH